MTIEKIGQVAGRLIGLVIASISIYKLGGIWWLTLFLGIGMWMPQWWLVK